ncbi:MAG TPA: GntR family transcriptional regulator [Pyrinomonadaceae bacterium]|jgi:GntR family transcriptional regulator|nr:GntR family transcriptional regulator [Pyrinomonadaceae bacterium]
MFFKPNYASGVAIYVQLMEQVRHAIETGALRPGDQLPPIRKVAEDLVINPNTVAKVYRELEHEGVIELRHGAGAFVAARGREPEARSESLRRGQPVVRNAVAKLEALGLSEEEMRRLFEAELTRLREGGERELAAAARKKP